MPPWPTRRRPRSSGCGWPTRRPRSEAQSETQRLRTALLSSLSHDLRTPLTGIRGAAGSLRTTGTTLDDATRADLLASIEQDTERMTRFLANIMDMTRLETGEILPRRQAIELAEVVEAAIARVPGALHVTVDIAPAMPRITADPALLEQVLVNVLDNAVKYSPAGAAISVSAAGLAGVAAIRVADHGIGISAEDLPHVFDSFYRAQPGRPDGARHRARPGYRAGAGRRRWAARSKRSARARTSPRDGLPGTVITVRLPVAGAGGA